MQSVHYLRRLLISHGLSHFDAGRYVDALVTHASVCRARSDAPLGAFRSFVNAASRMTRSDYFVTRLATPDDRYAGESAAACEALHDLIMEGVQ